MKRKKSEILTDVLLRFLREAGLESPLNQYRLIQAWKDIAGQAAASQTHNIYIKNQTLIVQITSPALRTNLLMCKHQLVKKLNAAVKADVITDLVIY